MSLHDIDETDIESLIPFLFRYPKWLDEHREGGPSVPHKVFADQVDWL